MSRSGALIGHRTSQLDHQTIWLTTCALGIAACRHGLNVASLICIPQADKGS